MEDSILNSVKILLPVDLEETVFDQQLILYINMGLNTLRQLGVGAKDGFIITGPDETLQDFLGEGVDTKTFEMVKMYLYLETKILWDSGTASSFVITALKEKAQEIEGRLLYQCDPVTTFT